MQLQVVPFTPYSGLVEWVHNTVPLVDCLVGSDRQTGLHKRYAQPTDYSFMQCSARMHQAKQAKMSEKRRVFADVSGCA